MKVYTCQMASWRKAKELGVEFKDITVKSGDKRFAPSWDLLMSYKSTFDEEMYTKGYIELMRDSFKNNRQYWVDFCKQDAIVLACYCGKGKFCHRHLLVEMLEKVCKSLDISFERGGEL